MKKLYVSLLATFAISILFAQKIPFQGRLLDNGRPFNGTANIVFSISSPSWSETKNNVPVSDGYYSVILGATTPLPDTLFAESREVTLNITVNGEALSAVTLHSPLLPFTGSNPVEIDTLRTLALDILGESDAPKVRLGTSSNGYEGLVLIKDSLDNTGAFMQTDGNESTGFMRGYLQLNGRESSGGLRSAVAVGASVQGRANSFMDLYGGNSAGDAATLLVDVYATDIDLNGPIADGYRRGGIDIYNYFGGFTHNIFSEHVGTSAISNLNINASQDDGTTQYTLNLNSGDGVTTGGAISLRNAGQAETIRLDGTNGRIDAQQILINGVPVGGSGGGTISPDSVNAKSVHVLGNNGEVKADLNFFDPNNAGSLVLYGANDSTKVILGSASGGYGGFLGLYDSLRNIGAQLRVTNKGRGNLYTYNEAHRNVGWFGGLGNDGFIQLVSYNSTDSVVSGAALIGSFIDGNLPEYYLEGSAQPNFGLGRFMVTPLGNSSDETTRLEINRSNGGGQAVMTIIQDDGGSDPTGASGQIDLWADNSINFQIGAQAFEDHDLPVINMYGSIDNGGGWWFNSGQWHTARTSDGTQEFGNLSLFNNQAGVSNFSANLTGNLYETGGGGLELFDAAGTGRVTLEASVGRINAMGPSGNLNVSLRGRGDSDFGYAEMFNNLGEVRAEIGSFGDNSGFMILYGNNGNKNIQIDRDPGNTDLGQLNIFGTDGITARVFATAATDGTNEWGQISIDGPTGGINLDGNNGTIDAQQILVQGVPIPSAVGGNIAPDTVETAFLKMLNGVGNEGVYLKGGIEGGTIQLSSPDPTNTFNRATFFAGTTSNGESSFANLYGMNPTSNGEVLLINNYNTTNSVFNTPFTGGYRRAGTDYYDNEGTFLAAIGSNRDETGGDPTGKSGLVMVNGPTTRNVYVSGQWWANSELGVVQVFGQNDNGSGDFSSNIELFAEDQAGESSGRISIYNTANGGVVNETILLSSHNGLGHGLMQIRDSVSTTTITMDGGNGDITAVGTVTATVVNQTSDQRLKKNISTLKNPLEKTLQLRGVSYQWKDESKSQQSQIGVIAQEVEAIYPEFVHTDEKGMKAVNYAQMTAVLIEAIKELNGKIEALETENASLKASLNEVKALRAQMDALLDQLGGTKAAGK